MPRHGKEEGAKTKEDRKKGASRGASEVAAVQRLLMAPGLGGWERIYLMVCSDH